MANGDEKKKAEGDAQRAMVVLAFDEIMVRGTQMASTVGSPLRYSQVKLEPTGDEDTREANALHWRDQLKDLVEAGNTVVIAAYGEEDSFTSTPDTLGENSSDIDLIKGYLKDVVHLDEATLKKIHIEVQEKPAQIPVEKLHYDAHITSAIQHFHPDLTPGQRSEYYPSVVLIGNKFSTDTAESRLKTATGLRAQTVTVPVDDPSVTAKDMMDVSLPGKIKDADAAVKALEERLSASAAPPVVPKPAAKSPVIPPPAAEAELVAPPTVPKVSGIIRPTIILGFEDLMIKDRTSKAKASDNAIKSNDPNVRQNELESALTNSSIVGGAKYWKDTIEELVGKGYPVGIVSTSNSGDARDLQTEKSLLEDHLINKIGLDRKLVEENLRIEVQLPAADGSHTSAVNQVIRDVNAARTLGDSKQWDDKQCQQMYSSVVLIDHEAACNTLVPMKMKGVHVGKEEYINKVSIQDVIQSTLPDALANAATACQEQQKLYEQSQRKREEDEYKKLCEDYQSEFRANFRKNWVKIRDLTDKEKTKFAQANLTLSQGSDATHENNIPDGVYRRGGAILGGPKIFVYNGVVRCKDPTESMNLLRDNHVFSVKVSYKSVAEVNLVELDNMFDHAINKTQQTIQFDENIKSLLDTLSAKGVKNAEALKALRGEEPFKQMNNMHFKALTKFVEQHEGQDLKAYFAERQQQAQIAHDRKFDKITEYKEKQVSRDIQSSLLDKTHSPLKKSSAKDWENLYAEAKLPEAKKENNNMGIIKGYLDAIAKHTAVTDKERDKLENYFDHKLTRLADKFEQAPDDTVIQNQISGLQADFKKLDQDDKLFAGMVARYENAKDQHQQPELKEALAALNKEYKAVLAQLKEFKKMKPEEIIDPSEKERLRILESRKTEIEGLSKRYHEMGKHLDQQAKEIPQFVANMNGKLDKALQAPAPQPE